MGGSVGRSERNLVVRRLLDLARASHADTVPVRQQLRHHHGVIRRTAALAAVVRIDNRRQIEFLDRLTYEVREMVLRQPILQARRHQHHLVGLIRPKIVLVVHARIHTMLVKR